eukprot:CAMPEP_0197496412 /NCGR_PEP_ID=MMETSP1311-20131121/44301_1 /TAXON_ID=464262 /ORGANISM="Genus nov. species nov., Strain RCC856" /LENGTH=57 /DNA_ID=CAMNT_0043041989 /DNA_START=223 /DNA_END=393 /DNA_ORIENTATION=-
MLNNGTMFTCSAGTMSPKHISCFLRGIDMHLSMYLAPASTEHMNMMGRCSHRPPTLR